MQIDSPDAVTCDFCHVRSPLPEDVGQQLRAAASVLRKTDANRRRLTKTQQRALTRVKSGRAGLWFIFGVYFLATGVWSIASGAVFFSEESILWDEQLMVLVMGVLPLVLVTLVAWRVFSRLTARRMALAELCAASPPVHPGTPARCRVCSAPVQTQGVAAVATCDYCGADNLVSRDVLERAALRVREATRDIEAQVREGQTDVGAALMGAWVKAVLSALFVPAAAMVVVLSIAFWVALVDREPDLTAQYVVVEHEGRRCVGWLGRGDQVELREVGVLAPDRRPLAEHRVHERLGPKDFVGRRLVERRLTEPAAASWPVKEVRRTLGGRNFAAFEEMDAPHQQALETFCLSEESAGT